MLKKVLLAGSAMSMLFPTLAFASEGPSSTVLDMGLNTIWLMLSFILVLLMQGGFILLETGSTRMKNAGHVAGKTIFTVGLGTLVFWAVGYGFIWGENSNPFIATGSFFFAPPIGAEEGYPASIDFLFQLAFAMISLTVAFGGFAERAKLSVYVLFSILFTALVYPVIAHWIWGGGWLTGHKQDFAGSTVVHLTGAAAALAATILLKPRIGKFNKDGTANEIHGHNQVYTALGVLLLWVGWFGFNAGSTLSVGDGFLGYVGFTTMIATGAGAVAAMFISWLSSGKADITTTLNGTLAGLVAITASCAFVDPWAAVVIGLVAGVLVYGSMKLFEKLKIDDPIYALSVHGTVGIWGTLANGIFASPALVERVGIGEAGLIYTGSFSQLWVQFYGVAVSGLFAFVVSFVLLLIIKAIVGLRVTEEQEIVGLDLSEHGVYGYPEQMKKSSVNG
ncbi:ammonium transporter [Paenibacillus sp.]|uniref:ammonium transporter n=1 Tax=Paenibacillus sp. TaxID=58172 RepID=UPI002D6D588B|nr:ammonium transporter [Paenibacillus sp.]HZG56598.1 ammonium transporter [Paenibacillus sp.]